MPPLFSHRVEVFTDSLMMSGWYDLNIYRRVSDALNGEQRRYLALRDAQVTPLDRPNASQRVPNLLVTLSEAILVTTVEEATPPAGYEREDLLRGKRVHSVMFFTGPFAVRAVFQTRADLELLEELDRLEDTFLRLSKVQIFPIRGGQPSSRNFAALRREAILALYPLADTPLTVPVPPLPLESPPTALPPVPPQPAPDLTEQE